MAKTKQPYTGRPLKVLLALPDAAYVLSEEAALMLGSSHAALIVRRTRDAREGRPVWPKPIRLGRLVRYQAGDIRRPDPATTAYGRRARRELAAIPA